MVPLLLADLHFPLLQYFLDDCIDIVRSKGFLEVPSLGYFALGYVHEDIRDLHDIIKIGFPAIIVVPSLILEDEASRRTHRS